MVLNSSVGTAASWELYCIPNEDTQKSSQNTSKLILVISIKVIQDDQVRFLLGVQGYYHCNPLRQQCKTEKPYTWSNGDRPIHEQNPKH